MIPPGSPQERALAAVAASGIEHTVTRHGPVESLAQAASARGLEPGDILKTLVVRRGHGDYVLVLVPGDRTLSWPKLRAVLGVKRLSLPPAAEAWAATGYERGTITPFGATTAWPVVMDQSATGRTVSVGGGGHGVAVSVAGDDLARVVGAQVADVTDLAC